MGISIDKEEIWKLSVAVGRSGNWWKNLWKRWNIKRNSEEIPLQLQVDKYKMRQRIKELTITWYQAPQDAQIHIKRDNSIEIRAHELGREVDINTAVTEIEQAISLAPGAAIEVSLHFIVVKPAIQKSDIEAYNIEGLVTSFTTKFNAERINRTHNIELAAKSLDNCLVAPGEVFSFNDVVGPRTKEKGYDEADIILQNELVLGIGGGVCQVSTTLYNTVLQAELAIVERTPHSMRISYVAPGLDATVVYGYRDLKFRNNTSTHLIIKTLVYQGNLEIKIFGKPVTGRKVVIRSRKEKEIFPETIYQEDPLVPKGKYLLEKEGAKGYIYIVERFVYDDAGKLLRTDQISRDYYPPIDRVIRTAVDSPLLSYLRHL
jgi:vancomycin resistance protein YoaR